MELAQLLFAGISAVAAAIQVWQAEHNHRRAAQVFDETYKQASTSDQTVQAAEQLFVSPVTVRRHLSNVVKKLDVSDREAALHLLDERA